MNPSGEERDEGGHAPAHMDTRLNPSGQVPSCPSPGASPTTPRPITELDRLTGRRSWPQLRPEYLRIAKRLLRQDELGCCNEVDVLSRERA
jgi:hypothetical protein